MQDVFTVRRALPKGRTLVLLNGKPIVGIRPNDLLSEFKFRQMNPV